MQYYSPEKARQPLSTCGNKYRRWLQATATKQALSSRGEDGNTTPPAVQLPVGRLYRKSRSRSAATQGRRIELVHRARPTMKKNGRSPVASGDVGGDSWSILRRLDYLNLRTNGVRLPLSGGCGGQSPDRQPRGALLDHWRELAPTYHRAPPDAPGRTPAASPWSTEVRQAVIAFSSSDSISPTRRYGGTSASSPLPEVTHLRPTVRRAPTDASCSRSPKTTAAPRKFPLEFLAEPIRRAVQWGVDQQTSAGNEQALRRTRTTHAE